MTVPMDGPVDPSSVDRAQRLFKKNVELQNQRRRSAQERTSSDPSIWHQMRENYESIILEDHDFAEKHEVEFALWQLHYKRIEELRAHLNAAASANSAAAQNGKESTRPDRITKIRSQFKSFLSEATGFYHDLILKIRAKYGLPLPENQMVTCKDGNKSAEMKKGLISCHRCLIYVGDLSRYKGLYGDGDSKAGDFAAASSYYMQASSLWPPSGNPHHQLAILASYSGDELVAIYHYFRSLAVDNPFSTARDNLIIAFEKNRQSFTQLAADAKASIVKTSPARKNWKGRGKGRAVRPAKDSRVEASGIKGIGSTVAEIFRAFIVRFVRLNGILFTRTSLETFEDVFSMIKVDLLELLSSGPEEKYNFASAAEDSKIVIVRLIAILIFTVHNVNRDTENKSYAEILQRSVLLDNALTAVFEIMGLILERSGQLHNISSSFLLPGVLIFLEWLACHPEITSGSEVKEKQAAARSLFWNSCISFLNKLMSSDFSSMDENADESFFLKMSSSYDECETINRLALWEDFELRGFLPLAPAHQILDFSGKHSVGSDGVNTEEKMRIQRIISAGKALTKIDHIGHEGIYFDPKSNEFVVGNAPQIYDDDLPSSLEVPDTNDMQHVLTLENQKNMRGLQPHVQGDEEDEVIVFRPSLIDKYAGQTVPELASFEVLETGVGTASINLGSGVGSISSSVSSCSLPSSFDTSVRLSPTPVVNMYQQLHSIPTSASQWLQQKAMLANGLGKLNLMGNVCATASGLPQHLGVPQSSVSPIFFPPSVSANGNEYSARVSDTVVQSKFDIIISSGATSDSMAMNPSMALLANSRKNPASRPVRHLGPPPGFSPVPSKVSDESLSGITLKNENMQQDDYSWLDGYHLQSSAKGPGFNNFVNQSAPTRLSTSKSSNMTGTMAFPFPGKQIPVVQGHDGSQRNWHGYNLPGRFKSYQEQLQQQEVWKIHQQSIPVPEHQGQQSIPMPGDQGQLWENRFFV